MGESHSVEEKPKSEVKRKIVIREAFADDRKALQAMLIDAYREYEQLMPQEHWLEYKASIIKAIDDSASSAKLVAELDGELIGSVFMYDSSKTAYGNPGLAIESPIIRLLGVSPKARGFGAATELIRASARIARAEGAATLYLHTSDMMDSAVRLYERLGFERAYDKEFTVGQVLVKSYRLQLATTSLL